MKVHTIDLNFRGADNAIAAFLVEGSDGPVLVESGPGSTLAALRRGLTDIGFTPSDVRHVFVTHIHLDHAGAAGWWGEQGARVYVHPAGARHLIDPSRLIDSARLIYGDAMDSLWGEIRPVPAGQLTEVTDGEVIRIGDLEITAWDTPGHARHHHCYHVGDVLFTGDVAGVRMPGADFISVTGAPPQFDPPAYDASLERLERSGDFKRIYLTHFGVVEDAVDHLRRYREIVRESAEWMAAQVEEGISDAETRTRYHAWCRQRAGRDGVSDAGWEQYETANPCDMCADGIALYWKKRDREK